MGGRGSSESCGRLSSDSDQPEIVTSKRRMILSMEK